MSPFDKFQKAVKGTSLEPVAQQYKEVADEAAAQLKAKQAKDREDRFGKSQRSV